MLKLGLGPVPVHEPVLVLALEPEPGLEPVSAEPGQHFRVTALLVLVPALPEIAAIVEHAAPPAGQLVALVAAPPALAAALVALVAAPAAVIVVAVLAETVVLGWHQQMLQLHPEPAAEAQGADSSRHKVRLQIMA